MEKVPRIAAIVSIVAGAILIVAGIGTYYLVKRELFRRAAEVRGNVSACPVDGAHDLTLVFWVGVGSCGQSTDLTR